jgi:pimeloyl-ACP methyl ester carboxylesterase
MNSKNGVCLYKGDSMLKHLKTSKISIGYEEYGADKNTNVILLHGFPYDVCAYHKVCEYLKDDDLHIYVPYLRGFGSTKLASDNRIKSGQQAAIAQDLITFMDGLDIKTAILMGYDWGGRAACIVSALWPRRVIGLITGGGYNIQNIKMAMVPELPEIEQRYWYQYYFHSERGRNGLEKYRNELCKQLWYKWSPTWKFSNDEFENTAKSFWNEDFIDIVIHSYRHRFMLAEGDSDFEYIEQKLAKIPQIKVPTIVLEGEKDDVELIGSSNHLDHLFIDLIARRNLRNVGHNIPREAPIEVAKTIREISSMVIKTK